ncbi:unnamed protein product [Diatraea saccharalis]|uniref:Uncharacterized protein n=1 Tax=Diatraea saccharalis TaxID=40085 RepID=A0A9N9RGZ3_9NEOP|nr:unnamed protein product [Diatraea saccharalis]
MIDRRSLCQHRAERLIATLPFRVDGESDRRPPCEYANLNYSIQVTSKLRGELTGQSSSMQITLSTRQPNYQEVNLNKDKYRPRGDNANRSEAVMGADWGAR